MRKALCHALRVRLTGQADTDTAWVEDIPAPSTDPRALRRVAVEMARPAERLRRVVLRFTDGVQDMVVVAPRDHFDRAALSRLASGKPVALAAVRDTGGIPAAAPPPAWGLAEGVAAVVHQQPIDAPGDERNWLVALAVTLRRYDPENPPVIGLERSAVTVSTGATLGDLRPEPAAGPAVAGLLFDDAELAGEYLPCLTPPFPLTVSVFHDEHGWQMRCDHLGSHLSPEIGAQFTRHLVHVHHQVLHSPQTPVEDVVLLDSAEQDRVAALGRAPAPLVTTPVTAQERFSRIAAETPDAIALTDGSDELTYRELDERSTRLAGGLRAKGVDRGDHVGVCLERSAEFVIAILGVLKAGATYVPLDPAYPVDRLAYTARDARLTTVITRLPQFPYGTSVTPDELSGPPTSGDVTPDDAMYVIYTSGSSGRPKGVAVPHRNVISLIDATRHEYGLGAGEVWTWFHSGAFDFSIWEIWGCLLTGGRLVVVPYFVSREPDSFRDLLVAEKVTVLSQTPSAFAQLLDVEHADVTARLIVFGGEPLDARMLVPWFDRHPESACRVVNMFGITETTVHVTAQTVTRKLALAASRSVGRALPGWYLYVLDQAGRLVPPGVPGEICVGGAGVALGYLGQDELTADRFRPDPYAEGTMYRSGDLGRLRTDGTLEHLGRLDNQVKVRGFRIELDEIRAVLLEDPAVHAAAVVVRRDDPADAATARIDAYVVFDGDDISTVRARVAKALPDYMVPATVTSLSALPLTHNGKLDSARLPVPTTTAVPDEVPQDEELGHRLEQLWSRVLGVPVGMDDDFFELGGNSLLAVRLSAAMRVNGLPALRLRELYRHPTIRDMVASLE